VFPTATLVKVLKQSSVTCDAVYELKPPMFDRRQPEIAITFVRVVSTLNALTGAGSVQVLECDGRGGAVSLPLNAVKGSREGAFDHAFALAEAGYRHLVMPESAGV
jgi:hypothetical protein